MSERLPAYVNQQVIERLPQMTSDQNMLYYWSTRLDQSTEHHWRFMRMLVKRTSKGYIGKFSETESKLGKTISSKTEKVQLGDDAATAHEIALSKWFEKPMFIKHRKSVSVIKWFI